MSVIRSDRKTRHEHDRTTYTLRLANTVFTDTLGGEMTQEQIHDAVLAFLRTSIIYDEKRVIPDDESFLATGILDSTGILELIGYLESEFGVRFLDEELVADNFDSLARITRFMSEKLAQSRKA
jgi:acyl carrier protein